MTVTDFTLMAVLVIVITLGLIRASGVKSYFERGIFTLGGVTLTLFVMTIISACFREEVKVDTPSTGLDQESGSDPVGSHNPTQTVLNAYFSGARYPHLDVDLLELEKTRIRKLIDDGEIAESGSRLKEYLIGIDTYPGLLKYLSQVAELAPLLDFWEELRIIRGGLL